jgi:hypothetical protein
MGFFIQDDYIDSMADMTKAEQNVFLGAIFRLYMTGVSEADGIKSKAVRVAFNACKGRVISARKEADKKAKQRDGAADNEGTDTGTDAGTNGGTNIGNALKREGEGDREVEIEGDVYDDVVVPLAVYEGGEIVSTPDGYPHFLAEVVKLFNAATGQAYTYPPVKVERGIREAFDAGHTLDDVRKVMDDVAKWPKNMQTFSGVFADGKFEQHLNRPTDDWGGDDRDWSQYDYLAQ